MYFCTLLLSFAYKTDLKESGKLCSACRVRPIKTTKKLENLENVSDEQTPVRGKRHVILTSIRKKQLLFDLGLNVEDSNSSLELGYLKHPSVTHPIAQLYSWVFLLRGRAKPRGE